MAKKLNVLLGICLEDNKINGKLIAGGAIDLLIYNINFETCLFDW